MSPLLPPLGLLVETVLDPYALDPDPIVSVNVPVLALRLILEPWLLTASDLTPVFAICILFVPLETLIPLPALIVASANPLDEPISN